MNLLRRSHPIAFRIFADHDGPSGAPDPAGFPADGCVPGIDDRCDHSTHSGYQFTATDREVVSRWGLGDRTA